jgi:hypothetical protein
MPSERNWLVGMHYVTSPCNACQPAKQSVRQICIVYKAIVNRANQLFGTLHGMRCNVSQIAKGVDLFQHGLI